MSSLFCQIRCMCGEVFQATVETHVTHVRHANCGAVYCITAAGAYTTHMSRDESPCPGCQRKNDVGAKSCWCCGGRLEA